MEQENSLNQEEQIQTQEAAGQVESQQVTVAECVPAIDFSAMTCDEIVKSLQKLLDEYPVAALRETMEKLPQQFDARYKAEYEAALAAFTADGDSPEGFEYKNDSRERFNNLCKQYKEKKTQATRQAEAEREENLKIKLGIVEELKALVQKEEALDKTFQEFRDLQERWRATGAVPQGQLNGLLETYHLHVENFYNYIKINKELRDLDLKRNLDAKVQLCEEAEKLAETNDIAGAFKQLQLLHARWKEIGPIAKELKEPTWERFKVATGQINEKYHRFFESLKAEQENNLKLKEDICERAAAIAAAEYNTLQEWTAGVKKITDLQEEWKQSGTVPQKERNSIYKKFRASCDVFFERKRAFYKEVLAEQNKNLELKIRLCEKVEALQNSTDWKVTTDKIIACQKEWKKIGSAPRKYSNKVWMRFRAACDVFFNNKAAHFKDIDAEQEKNLEQKKALLEEVRNFTLSGNNEQDIARLKEFQSRWSEIGFVPIKQKEAVTEEFRSVINGWFDKLNLDEFDRDLERYRARLSTLEAGDNKEYKIVNEREKLVAKIRQLETDIHTWENNVGFISRSGNAQGLIREMNDKIEKAKQRLVLMQEKLKALDTLI